MSEELLSAISLLLLLLGYIAVGCVFVAGVEHWTLVKSAYYWGVTFTTVGFGDINQSVETQVKYLAVLVVYRSFRLALLTSFIDSILVWIKVRRNYFEVEARRLKEINETTLGKKKYYTGVSVENGHNREYQLGQSHDLKASSDFLTFLT